MLLVIPSFPSLTVNESLTSTNLVFKQHTPLDFSTPITFLSSDPLYFSLLGPLIGFPKRRVWLCIFTPLPGPMTLHLHPFAGTNLHLYPPLWPNFHSPFKMYTVSWHSELSKISSSFEHPWYFLCSYLRHFYSPCITLTWVAVPISTSHLSPSRTRTFVYLSSRELGREFVAKSLSLFSLVCYSFFLNIYLFIWLCWVLVAACGI